MAKATDSAQSLVWDVQRTPFGKRTVRTADIKMPLGFPGQYFDEESGKYYNYFRDYDPSTGRYLQSDPTGLEGGLNTYAYVEGNPIKYSDEYGLAVNICLYPNAAMGAGHIGFGLDTESGTQGFYPLGNPIDSPGVVKPDSGP